MNKQDIATTKTLLNSQEKIIIIPHKNPDGDAIGSTLGLWHYLKAKGKNAHIIAPNDFPDFLKWMPGADQIVNFETEHDRATHLLQEADLIFTLDFNHLGRTGHMEAPLTHSKATFIMIDHHEQPTDYATVTYSVPGMSSTCEMVYRFIDALGDRNLIGSEIANCLYAGIMTDTGSFKFPATTADTHRIVAELIEKGAQNNEVHRLVYDQDTPSRLHLLGCALKNMVILPEYASAYITLSQDELDTHGFKKGDTEGFVNYGLTLKGIIFAVIFIENRDEGIIKISLRSQGDFSVNDFARNHFEGGGHLNAAGGRSERSLQDTVAYFRSLLETYKKTLQA